MAAVALAVRRGITSISCHGRDCKTLLDVTRDRVSSVISSVMYGPRFPFLFNLLVICKWCVRSCYRNYLASKIHQLSASVKQVRGTIQSISNAAVQYNGGAHESCDTWPLIQLT